MPYSPDILHKKSCALGHGQGPHPSFFFSSQPPTVENDSEWSALPSKRTCEGDRVKRGALLHDHLRNPRRKGPTAPCNGASPPTPGAPVRPVLRPRSDLCPCSRPSGCRHLSRS